MILDKQNLLSDDQDLAQTAATYLCTNAIDLGVPGTDSLGNTVRKDLGRGNHVELLVQITETFTSGGAATLKVQLITDDAAALGSPTILQSTEAIALATLVAGYQFRISVPVGVAERYLGVQYVIGTATTTAGKVTAGIVDARQSSSV
jgi:hypothetical protein